MPHCTDSPPSPVSTPVHSLRPPCWLAGAILLLTLSIGCAGLYGARSVPAGTPAGGWPAGLLPKSAVPDSAALLPPPPTPGSAAFAADQAAFRQALAYRGTPRWDLAIADADVSSAAAPAAFSCAIGLPITREATPRLLTLLERARTDASHTGAPAKRRYQRIRPFVVHQQVSCTPGDEASLRTNGSYPSGHTTIGWTWTLILASLVPEWTDRILARGLAYGQSRVICGVHWQSDVTAGLVVASTLVARLYADPGFRAELEAIRAELTRARSQGLKPTRDCQAEAAALAYQPPERSTPAHSTASGTPPAFPTKRSTP